MAHEAIEKLVKEFKGELTQIGQNVTQILTRLAKLESDFKALSETVADHEKRISELERFRWFASVKTSVGFDGTAAKSGAGEQCTVKPNHAHWFQGGLEGSVNLAFQNRVNEDLNIFTDPASTGCPVPMTSY